MSHLFIRVMLPKNVHTVEKTCGSAYYLIFLNFIVNLHFFSIFFLQIADIREFEEFADTISDMEKFPLYQSAMRHFEETPIPVRQIRTEMVNCASDLEYLAKLHCIRLAFQYLFRVNSTISLKIHFFKC